MREGRQKKKEKKENLLWMLVRLTLEPSHVLAFDMHAHALAHTHQIKSWPSVLLDHISVNLLFSFTEPPVM